MKIYCAHEILQGSIGRPLHKPSSELIVLFGVLSETPDEKRFDDLIEHCNSHFEYVNSIAECDFIVYPFKFIDDQDLHYRSLAQAGAEHNKKIVCFTIDDSAQKFNLTENTILFRTSFSKTTKLENEFAMPTVIDDTSNSFLQIEPTTSIGFCGFATQYRNNVLSKLKDTSIQTDFILRKSFAAQEKEKQAAKIEFLSNLAYNTFNLCIRGDGNFSYRFYETMMMRRIPFLVNTDCVFPFDDTYDINDHCFVIDYDHVLAMEPKEIEKEFNQFIEKTDLKKMCERNYKLWEEKFSPKGFISTFADYAKGLK